MKKSLFLIIASVILISGFSLTAFGQTKAKRLQINKRQHNQQERIYNGISSGELNKRETYRLEKNQRKINRMETRFRKSGDELTKRERAKLLREQNQASRRIYRQKHD